MAWFVQKLTDKPRKNPWLGRVTDKGIHVKSKMWPTKQDAVAWCGEQDREVRRAGTLLPQERFRKVTVGDLVRRYLTDVIELREKKRSKERNQHVQLSDSAVLRKFLKHPICKKILALVKSEDAYEYVNWRLHQDTFKGPGWKKGKPISKETVKRECNTIRRVFNYAAKHWGYGGIVNPFSGIEIDDGSQDSPFRNRGLKKGELDRLMEASLKCRDKNKFYVPVAFLLAIETGMRRQEVFNLTWRDIDFEERTITIRRSKTGRPRVIVLTAGAMWYLKPLERTLADEGKLKQDARIFPITSGAFSQSWRDVLKRAGIKGLRYHDLRHEAASRFDAAELTTTQSEYMMGQIKKKDMNSNYVVKDDRLLKTIREKLDKYDYRDVAGKTPEQVSKETEEWLGVGRLDDVRFRGLEIS